MDTPTRIRRYTFAEHALTRAVAVLIVPAAVGPAIRDWRADELERYQRLPQEQLIEVLRAQASSDTVLETIGIAWIVGVLLLAAVEGISAVLRVWVIPRA